MKNAILERQNWLAILTALVCTVSSAARADKDGHGAGNGGDPREVMLYNRLQMIQDFIASDEGKASVPMTDLEREEILHAANSVYLRVSEDQEPCVVENAKPAVLRFSMKKACGDVLGQLDRLYARLWDFTLRQTSLSAARNEELKSALAQVASDRLGRSRRFLRHETCEAVVERRFLSGNSRSNIASLLKSRGYELVSKSKTALLLEREGDRLLVRAQGVVKGQTAQTIVEVEGVPSGANRIEFLIHLNRLPWCLKKIEMDLEK